MSLSAAVSKTKRIATGRVTETFSASQGGQSLSLFTYRNTFDNPQKLLAATVDYRNIVANNGGVLGVAGVPHVLLPEEVTGEGAR